MRFVTKGGEWEITLTDGNIVRVWADGYQTLDDHYDFGILVDTEGQPADTLLVTNGTPSDPNRVIISVARFPTSAVESIRGG